jgi:diguanylate cyclase (GGDEF)-like protein/PAS domain S-box-containing protein
LRPALHVRFGRLSGTELVGVSMNAGLAGRPAPDFDHDRLLQSAVIHANDAVMITDHGGATVPPRILYVNPAFTRLTGYASDEVLNRTPKLLQGVQTSLLSRAKMREAIATLQSISIDVCNYRKDGNPYFVELSLTPVLDEDGNCRHWIAIQRDVTERRRIEAIRARDQLTDEKQAAFLLEKKERERVEAQLAYRSVHDDLTGLFNRTHFMQCAQAAIARATVEPAYRFSILYVDLDQFKQVNDYLGHPAGDRILRDLSRRFEPLVGPNDTLARIGGDEFALLVDSPADVEVVLNAAGRLLMEVATRPRFRVDDLVISASIGIVHSTPELNDAELLMRDAEIALAVARQNAGGNVAVFTPEMHAQAAAAQGVRSDLYGAVERGELRLHYQPLIDITTGDIYGFEGLARWQHPVRGLVQPDEFIPAAEATGLIVELGRWVLLEGCRKAREFQRIAGRPLMMSLNVSSQQLLHPHFLDHVHAALEHSGIDAHTLQLEITESVFLAGGAVVGALFARIRALGVQIAFDDFGTGYSSLSYLERFQIDTLKIDRSFVGRIHDASAKSAILRMIIALAHALGVDIVAEGVENRAQRDALGHLGCTHHQGFLFSRPITDSAACAVLAALSDGGSELDPLLGETLRETSAAQLSSAGRIELREQVEAAIGVHDAWLDRLNTAVATGASPPDTALAGEDFCPIGIWLNSTLCESLRALPLYYVTRSRHAVFHRSAARLLAAVAAGQPDAALSLRPDGDLTRVAALLLGTLQDWLIIAAADPPPARETPAALAPPALADTGPERSSAVNT